MSVERTGDVQMTVIGGVTDQLKSLTDALGGESITGWQIVAALVVLVLTYPAARLVVRLVKRGMKKVPGLSDDLANDAATIARWVVYLVGLALSLSVLGVTLGFISILLVIIVILGALMAKPMIESSAAGMLLMARPSFSVGDQIQTSDHRGTVEEIGTRSTILRTSDGVRVHVPNQQVLGAPIQVFTAYDSRQATFDIHVSPDTDLDSALSTLTTAVAGADGVEDTPAPDIRAKGLTKSAVVVSISYWYPSTMSSGSSVTSSVVQAVKTALSASKIDLAVETIGVEETPDASTGSTAPPDEDTSDDTT